MSACGTVAGYLAHRRRGEAPCPDCLAAHAAEMRLGRARRVYDEVHPMPGARRAELLRRLGSLNKDLNRAQVAPLFHTESARAFSDQQLQAAVDLTADELVRMVQALGEAGG